MTAGGPQQPIPAPWRLVVFILASTAGVLGVGLVASPLARMLGGVIGIPITSWVNVWALAGGMLIGHWWTFRLVDARGWTFVGLGREALRPATLVGAALLGAGAILIPSAALLAAGWVQIVPAEPGSSLGAAAGLVPLLLPAALWEELLLRGYFFSALREVWGVWRTLLVTSAIFGLLHLQNAGATAQSVVLVTLAGVFLGSVLVRTGSLYAAWVAHFAWNFALAGGLHAAVSGLGFAMPDYTLVDTGPDWATGGQWGPEGGLFAGLGMLAGILILFRRPWGRTERVA